MGHWPWLAAFRESGGTPGVWRVQEFAEPLAAFSWLPTATVLCVGPEGFPAYSCLSRVQLTRVGTSAEAWQPAHVVLPAVVPHELLRQRLSRDGIPGLIPGSSWAFVPGRSHDPFTHGRVPTDSERP